MYTSETSGFQFKAQLVSDQLCVANDFCYTSDLFSVMSIQQNYWLYDQDIRDVGGLVGLSYTCKDCSSLWKSQPDTAPQFGIFLGEGSDYSWWEKAKDSFILTKRPSQLVLGENAKDMQLDRGEGKILKLVS